MQLPDPLFYVIIAGSRSLDSFVVVSATMDLMMKITGAEKLQPYQIQIISGGARGADTYAREYAELKGFSYKEFKPDWVHDGIRAGYIRNSVMHDYVSAECKRVVGSRKLCVCFWDGQSKGTRDNFQLCDKHITPLVTYNYNTGLVNPSEEFNKSFVYNGGKLRF